VNKVEIISSQLFSEKSKLRASYEMEFTKDADMRPPGEK
jgi:hypothetical protein